MVTQNFSILPYIINEISSTLLSIQRFVCISLAELNVDELFSKYEQVMTTSANSDSIKNELIEINKLIDII